MNPVIEIGKKQFLVSLVNVSFMLKKTTLPVISIKIETKTRKFSMNSLFFLPITIALGILLGNLYFRGLWMTVLQLPTTENPILLTFGSFFVRMAIAIAGFALVLAIAKEYAIWHLLICVVAFMWVRNRIIHQVQPKVRNDAY